jgi:uncharacterized protein
MKTFTGRAVRYNSVSEILYGRFREDILPGCFDESLRSNRDVYCSLDHDMNRVLGRLSAKTLVLKPDSEGITVDCSIGDYSYARDLATALQRGDLRGMSFIFDVLEDQWSYSGDTPLRRVKQADLYEVAFVFFPAYSETAAGMRSAQMQRAKAKLRLEEVLHSERETVLHGKHISTLYGDDVQRLRLKQFLNERRDLLFGKRKLLTPEIR